MAKKKSSEKKEKLTIFKVVTRFILGMIVLSITALLIPGFSINAGIKGGFTGWLLTLFLAVLILTVLDTLLLKLFKLEANVFGKGIVGFLLSAGILFLTGFILKGFEIGPISAIVAALIFGVVDAIIPGKTFFSN
jgi:uncharacterized membrane protein YvlD (DUF360 family)